MEDIVKKEYPNAQTGEFITESYLDFLTNEYQSDLERMLFATSLCSDDVNVSTDFRRVLARPFTMGGLGGIPFTGYTGMVAFAHHVPDNGDAFILYGPHIGITEDGILGQMRRLGQERLTNSCGALMLALERLENGTESPVKELDYQQMMLEQYLAPFKNEILSDGNKPKKITDVTYNVIHTQVHILANLARKEFNCKRLFLLGGVIINTHPGAPDYVDVRNFEVITIADQSEEKAVSILGSKAFKEL